MRGNKGFTLVELLAVLVILAIIALITTPIILGVIEESRLSAAKDKTWAYVDAVENAFALDQASLDPTPMTSSGISGDITGSVGTQKIRVSGDRAESGTYNITSEGIVTIKNLIFDDYKCSTVSEGDAPNIDVVDVDCQLKS